METESIRNKLLWNCTEVGSWCGCLGLHLSVITEVTCAKTNHTKGENERGAQVWTQSDDHFDTIKWFAGISPEHPANYLLSGTTQWPLITMSRQCSLQVVENCSGLRNPTKETKHWAGFQTSQITVQSKSEGSSLFRALWVAQRGLHNICHVVLMFWLISIQSRSQI